MSGPTTESAPDGPQPRPGPPDGSAAGDGPGPGAGWTRPFLAVVAVVGLLLLGGAGGLLIGLPSATPATPGADSVDVGFAQDMSVHHYQAVEMASRERDHTGDPVLAQLAYDIEATQTAQIGRMQGWLELWNAASLPEGPHMAWMVEPGHSHSDSTSGAAATMPGMASSKELKALRGATGPQLDVMFLQLMLRHHEGGAAMLRYGAAHAAVPQVRNLAAQMLSSQSTESDYLRQLLAERGGRPLTL